MSSWRLSKVLCATSESEETYALFLVRVLQLFLQLAILNLRIWTLTDAILYVNDINYAYFTRRITETNQLWSNARFFCNLLIHLRFIHSTPEGEHLTGACRCVCVCVGGGATQDLAYPSANVQLRPCTTYSIIMFPRLNISWPRQN